AIPEFRRGRRPRQFRGNPARPRLPGGRVGLHASRPRHPGPGEDRRERHHHRARHRRSLHARIYQGVEATDEGVAQARGAAGAVSTSMQLTHDPSLSSYYVNEQLYQSLVDSFTDWQKDELAISAPDERDRFRMLVEKEARLLDQLAFDEWLAM